MKIGIGRKEHIEKEEAERKRKVEIDAVASKRNIPYPRCSVSAMAMNFYRNVTTEEIVINTLNNEANKNKVAFEYNRIGDRKFEVNMEGTFLCHNSFDEMERLLQDSLNTYISFWRNIIKNALTTDIV